MNLNLNLPAASRFAFAIELVIMDIYKKKSRWKLYLVGLGMLIILASLWYTNTLARKLAEEERKKTEIYLMALEELNEFDEEDFKNGQDVSLHYRILKSNTTIPVMIIDERGHLVASANFPENIQKDTLLMEAMSQKMIEEGFEPIQGYAASVFYQESSLLKQVRFYPLIQLLLIATFILFGYLALNTARKAEQNRVWAGMAKETAHQLGTPISAIMAWVENLKLLKEDDEEVQEIAVELEKDINRLELVADRFSKIGSEPKLETVNIYEELEECRAYMAKRAPRKVQFDFPASTQGDIKVSINSHLFDWVVENLLRNALDAMDGKGLLSANVFIEGKYVNIDISDTGKGIPSGKHKTIFSPGYTTKKRGWGLGLSLSKRIIEGYHKGKIFVKKSTPGEGTTFTIRLPLAD